jgi:hypothetical protein
MGLPCVVGGTDRGDVVLGSGGEPFVDPDGGAWSMTGRHLDLRVVRRRLRSEGILVLAGCDGCDIHWVAPEQRSELWGQVRKSYRGPGGGPCGQFMGFEFVNDSGDRLLYLQKPC